MPNGGLHNMDAVYGLRDAHETIDRLRAQVKELEQDNERLMYELADAERRASHSLDQNRNPDGEA
jgi:prefoldin subunit 5